MGPRAARKRLTATLERLEGAYSHATLRAYRADFLKFIALCETRGLSPLPAPPAAICAFLRDLMALGKRPNSIRRALCGLSALHLMNGLADPTHHLDVRLEMRRIYRQLGRHQRQALGVSRGMLERMVAACDGSLRGLRDAALLQVAYDTLCRRAELTALQVEDVHRPGPDDHPDTPPLVLELKRSKTDPDGAGRWLLLQPAAITALERWLTAAGHTSGPLFRGVTRGGKLSAGLDVGGVGRVYKAAARRAGLPPEVVRAISSHSLRVGAAQDLLLSGASLPVIMHRGRWTKPDTVMRYVERYGRTW